MLVQRIGNQDAENNGQGQADDVNEQRANYGGIVDHMTIAAFIATNFEPAMFKLILFLFTIWHRKLNQFLRFLANIFRAKKMSFDLSLSIVNLNHATEDAGMFVNRPCAGE